VAGVIVLDASVLIAYLDGEDRHHRRAEAVLVAAVDDDLGAHSLTLAEVLVVPVGEGRLEPVMAALRDLEVKEVPFPPNAAVRLAQLRATTGLKMPDCCVLLAAEAVGGAVASFDERLAEAADRLHLAVVRG
jgi:predicted nucleic acid-binding protein